MLTYVFTPVTQLPIRINLNVHLIHEIPRGRQRMSFLLMEMFIMITRFFPETAVYFVRGLTLSQRSELQCEGILASEWYETLIADCKQNLILRNVSSKHFSVN